LPEVPTNPDDKYRFTDLFRELHTAFQVDGFLLTFAGAPDPFKANNAYELDKIKDLFDWINIMTYDYSGPWDNFTGIDQPLYGRWGEGFVGHPKYQFNIHETVQHYLKNGIPPEKIAMGIHTESKGWVLDDNNKTGLYCPAYEPSPNVSFSRQEGWLFYYEILQFWHNETCEDPLWCDDLKVGKDHWTIHDKEHGDWDGCYLSPYMHQGRYWISYDDEDSVDVKMRYANHYGLRGGFVWEVDSDNFLGMYGKPSYNILRQLKTSLLSGETLLPEETLGYANENMDCSPQAPFCEDSIWGCERSSDCNEDETVICDDRLSNCFFCDHSDAQCKEGCSDNMNCPTGEICLAHICRPHMDFPAITDIIVKTASCHGCNHTSRVEEGLQVTLTGIYGAECTTAGLDNEELIDYITNHQAVFNSGSPDDGLGECNNYDLNVSLEGGSASWTGAGTWTGAAEKTICVDFFDPQHNKPTCCCELSQPLTSEDSPAPLTNCNCAL